MTSIFLKKGPDLATVNKFEYVLHSIFNQEFEFLDLAFHTLFLMKSILQASEALHMVGFEIFVKPMMSCLSCFKVTPSFCFPNAIPDNMIANIMYLLYISFQILSSIKFLQKLHTLSSLYPMESSKKF